MDTLKLTRAKNIIGTQYIGTYKEKNVVIERAVNKGIVFWYSSLNGIPLTRDRYLKDAKTNVMLFMV